MNNLVTALLALFAITGLLAAATGCRTHIPDTAPTPSPAPVDIRETSTPPEPTPTSVISLTNPALTGNAAESLERIALSDPATARALAGLPWLADDITLEERLTIEAIEAIAAENPSLARRIVGLPWVEFEVSDEEVSTIRAIGEIGEAEPALAEQVARSAWLADGANVEEQAALVFAADAAKDDPLQARQIVESQAREGTGRYYLESIKRYHPALAETLLQAFWVADGLDHMEGAALSGIRNIAGESSSLAQGIVGYPWVTDGITGHEATALVHLADLAAGGAPLGQRLAGYPWVSDGIEPHEARTLGHLLQLANLEPGDAELVAGQDWFQDELTAEEAALVVALRTVSDTSVPLEELVTSGEAHSRTFSLPSGEVNLFVVYRSSLQADVDQVFLGLEDGVTAIEDFMGPPWIMPEVIVHLEPGFEYLAEVDGANLGTHVVMRKTPGEPGFHETLYHELAHYYLKSYYMPHWLNEGWADFLASYTLVHRQGVGVQSRYVLAVQDVKARECPDQGVTNIHELLEATRGRQYLDYLRTPLWTCHYPLGESFLLGMYLALGRDGSTAALRSLYREAVSRSSRVSEDEIYREFLRHTPQGRKERFRAMYRCLHGRPIPGDAETDRTECDPITLAAGLNPEEKWTAASARWVFESGDTPLHRAMFGGQAQVVQRLLDEGGDVNAKTEIRHRLFGDPISDVTPLHIAAQHNSAEVAALLLDRGADISAKDSNGSTPLHQAARNHDPAVAALLLDRGADLAAQDEWDGTPLHLAAERNSNPEVAALLLDRGADINARGPTGWGYTPLLLAAEHNREPAVTALLLDRGADADAADLVWGAGPLHHAALSNGPEVVSLFVEHGAGVNDRDERGRTPLHYAVTNHLYDRAGSPGETNWVGPVIVALLLERGADPNARDNEGRTPLQPAFGETLAESVALLLERGVDINAKDEWGNTALHNAAIGDRQRQVRESLEQGADMEARNNDGLTPLHLAAGFRMLSDRAAEVAQVLLDQGADINARGNKGRTPLHYAAAPEPGPHSFPLDGSFYREVVPLLLDRGADVNAQDNNGVTPCERARRMGAMTGEALLERLCPP